MNFAQIQQACSNFTNEIATKKNSIKVTSYTEKYGAIGKKLHAFSKRVLQLEGVEEPESTGTPTETDLVLARALAQDIQRGGWEGAQQGVMKMFSLVLGRNLWAKDIGLQTSLELPKTTIVKHNDFGMCMLSDRGNLFRIQTDGSFAKERYVNARTDTITLATEDETILFIGTLFDDDKNARELSSTMEISSIEDLETAIAVSSNGLDMQLKDKLEFKGFMANINPDLTSGYKDAS